MYCRKCGVQINDTDTYCYNCGFNQKSGNVNNFSAPKVIFTEKPKSVFKQAWFWIVVVLACFCVFSVAISAFKLVEKIDFSEEFNNNNPFDYNEFFKEYEDFEEFDEDTFEHYYNFDFNIK